MSSNAIFPQGLGVFLLALAALMPAPAHAGGPAPAARQVWVVTTVGDAGRCFDEGASLALNDQGVPSISYLNFGSTDAQKEGLWYAHRETGGWVTEMVDPGNARGRHNSLALDSRQRPHISYRDGEAQELKYAAWDGSQWQVESVGLQGWHSALALDQQDRPHIAYLGSSQQPSYAVRADAGWMTEAIAPIFTFAGIGLALDANGRPHVSYLDGANLNYAYDDGTGWSIEAADVGITSTVFGQVGAYSALALDDQGDPHISYSRFSVDFFAGFQPGALLYAAKPATGWVTQTVSPLGATGIYSSLVLDDDGRPHISYWDSIAQELRYARWNGTGWTDVVVDASAVLEGRTSLKLDAAGRPHIAYCTGSEVRYAYLLEVSVQSHMPVIRVDTPFIPNP